MQMRTNCSTHCFGKLLRPLLIDLVLASLTLGLWATAIHAQEQGLVISGSAGYSPLVGDISSRLHNGWHVTVNGGYNFTSRFSTTLEYMYNGYGVRRRF